MAPTCCVCYENGVIKCFAGCANYLCMDCLIKLIEINKADMVSYNCPCCREEIIKNINVKFSNFCNREIEISRQIVSLLEKEISTKKKINLGEAWYIFQSTIIHIETNDIE
jgi:hypothetical protein